VNIGVFEKKYFGIFSDNFKEMDKVVIASGFGSRVCFLERQNGSCDS
jgi:hypothetical protein